MFKKLIKFIVPHFSLFSFIIFLLLFKDANLAVTNSLDSIYNWFVPRPKQAVTIEELAIVQQDVVKQFDKIYAYPSAKDWVFVGVSVVISLSIFGVLLWVKASTR